jgi:hemoglobin
LAIIAPEVGIVDGSLYERVGGTDGIRAATLAFEDRAAKDARINQKFARTDLDRLTKEFVDQVCQATGGPCTYTGRNMTETHANMGVTSGEFEAFIEDFIAVLGDFKVGQADQDQLVSFLRSFRGEIVEVDSSQEGTPLPSSFVPGPPL